MYTEEQLERIRAEGIVSAYRKKIYESLNPFYHATSTFPRGMAEELNLDTIARIRDGLDQAEYWLKKIEELKLPGTTPAPSSATPAGGIVITTIPPSYEPSMQTLQSK